MTTSLAAVDAEPPLELTRLADVLGHDLRNPLGAIAMGASFIARSSENEKIARAASRILASTERMTGMVEQMLEFARLRAGAAAPLQRMPLDAAELCARVREVLEADHPDRPIALETTGDTSGSWDYERILRVLSTIAGNAAVHGAPGGGVWIRVDGTAPNTVAIEIHNSGSMPPEVLATLFEPFRGAPRSGTQGLGLGLYIARQIIEAHGGTIDAASTEATGTTVRMRLPRE